MAKKFLSILLALVLVLGLMPAAGATAAATSPTFSDMPDNWATEALESAVANGLLVGDDGKIMPDSPLTRAQMATIIARAFGATKEGDISEYADVKSTDWFAGSMAKAYKMGVMQGYAGKMEPNSNISREQAFAVLARALKLEPASVLSKSFEDEGEISDWAKGEVYALVNAGYIQGSNGKLNPKANISRAEFAQMMHNLIKQYIKAEGEYTEVANGNIMVNVPGVTLKNVTINGDLIVGDGVGDGNLTLDNVTIKGRLLARGGGGRRDDERQPEHRVLNREDMPAQCVVDVDLHGRVGAQLDHLTGQPGQWMKEFNQKTNDDLYTFSYQPMFELLGQAMAKAKSTDPVKVAAALEGLRFKGFNGEDAQMRATDHQLQLGMWISKWQKVDAKNSYNVENTGYTFAPVKYLEPFVASTPTTCQMKRPGK